MGVVFPEGITVVPLNSLMKTLPSGAPSVLGTLTGSPHCRMNALVSAWALFALPYILGMVIDQAITVLGTGSKQLPHFCKIQERSVLLFHCTAKGIK